MSELFEIPETLSPRLAWIKKHGIQTEHRSECEFWDEHWRCWAHNYMKVEGHSEDEAITRWAVLYGIPLWNEEGLKP